jgi:hypothetical protein
MTVGGLVDTVFRFNRLCECHLYTAPRNMLVILELYTLKDILVELWEQLPYFWFLCRRTNPKFHLIY